MNIDRTYQLKLLKRLYEDYPRQCSDMAELIPQESDKEAYVTNIRYLEEHGLVIAHIQFGSDNYVSIGSPEITAKGVDFLCDDGGLSAILGVVTFRLHDDTVKALIEAKVHASDLPAPEKRRIVDQLRSLPADAIKHLSMKLIEAGLANAPAALTAIRTSLDGLMS